MIVRRLALGVSALALVSGIAQAQTSTNNSTVSQTGFNNNAIVDNARAGNDFNASTVIQNGRDNRVVVLQIGDFNTSQARQVADRNLILHTQEGDFHRAESIQNGFDNRSAIRQRGLSNSASLDQQGDRNVSAIAQGVEAGAAADYTASSFFDPGVAASRPGNDNRATVTQVGNDLSSSVRQRAAAGSSVAASENSATVAQRGRFNSAAVVQESRGNSATVRQFEGGDSAALGNSTSVVQRNSEATTADNPLSGNRADVAVAAQGNSGTVTQDGRNNLAELTQGHGRGLVTQISQLGSTGTNRVAVAQYGNNSTIAIGQNSAGATARVWQQLGLDAGGFSSNNVTEIRQGAGATGSDAFSAGFFGNAAPVTGAASNTLFADVTQGNRPAAASWNRAQVLQDGVNLSATIVQAGTGTADLPNFARVAQQGSGNTATARQGAGVGPSAAGDPASGQAGDERFFAGGARSAELVILQSGSNNSASIEQRGRGQYARIEQGPGSDNLATILQEGGATNATAIIRQTGSGNSYNVVQTAPGQYIRVVQTGTGNVVTDVVQRP